MVTANVNGLSLGRVKVQRLRPTQITVGVREVEAKRAHWAQLSRKQRKTALEQHLFPAVLGPGQRHYIVDHHHLGLALLLEGVKSAWVTVLDDLSWLAPQVFWRTMEFRSWAHPYDARGRRCDYRDIPKKLEQLQDDPYRSLSGLVRAAGGFAKYQTPFAEFLWADFFRSRIAPRLAATTPPQTLNTAVRLARSPEARYLPGWTGKAMP